ncbi:MAG: DUF4426 domain-containing protein [Gammaproteobacteria bacterium]|nr:DUF4426 domain-containing protein [Gammaproteobacteria bacterium]
MISPAARLWVAGNTRIAALALGLALTGCGGGTAPPPPAASYEDPGFVEAGGYRLRYALTQSTDLPAAIAGSYGIEQRRNLALLAVTLERLDTPAGRRVSAESLAAESVALTGERRALVLARHDDPGGPTWLAPVELRHRMPVTIEIRAQATAAGPVLRARLTREFRLE